MKIVSLLRASISFLLIYIVFPLEAQQNNVHLTWDINLSEKTDSKELLIPFKCDDCDQILVKKAVIPTYSFKISANAINTTSVSLKNIKTQFSPFNGFHTIIDEDFTIKKQVLYEKRRRFILITVTPIRKSGSKTEYLTDFEWDIKTIPNTDNPNTTKNKKDATYESVLNSGDFYKVKIESDGVFKITKTFLEANGIDINTVSMSKFKVYGNGGEMLPELIQTPRAEDLVENAIYSVDLNGNDKMDADDYLLWYAKGPTKFNYVPGSESYTAIGHDFDVASYYFFNWQGASGKRIASLPDGNNITPNLTLTEYDHLIYHERNEENHIKSGRVWWGDKMQLTTLKTFDYSVPGLLPKTGRLYTVTTARSTVNSSMNISLNETPISQVYYNWVTGEYDDDFADAPKTTIVSFNLSSTDVKLQYSYNKLQNDAAAYIDYFVLSLPRKMSAYSDQQTLRIDRLAVNGAIKYDFDNLIDHFVWNISDIGNPALQQTAKTGAGGYFTTSNVNTSNPPLFIVFNPNSAPLPNFIGKVENQNLHENTGTNYLIVTHKSLLDQANQLADFHRQRGLSVTVSSTEQIFNEFSSGSQDVTAIRDYAKLLYDRGDGNSDSLQYILLFGDASYDYKDVEPDNTNVVPIYQSYNSNQHTYSYCSDDYYAILDNSEGKWGTSSVNESLDIAVGRLPASNVTEAKILVDKIIHYHSEASKGDWINTLTFVADDEDRNDHLAPSEAMTSSLDLESPAYNIKKIWLDAYEQVSFGSGNKYPKVNEEITKMVSNRGTLIFNYVGHGGENSMAHERVVTRDEIVNWDNYDKLSFYITASCEIAKIDNLIVETPGELMLMDENGGAIGMVATTRAVYIGLNTRLNSSLVNDNLLKKVNGQKPAIGEAYRIMRNLSASEGTNQRCFILLGDPAMRLLDYQYDVVTTAINGTEIGLFSDTLKALSLVTIEGEIRGKDGQVVTDFMGEAYPTFYDKKSKYKTLGQDPSSKVIEFEEQNRIIYKGKVSVTNGKFSFKFVVPKDIAYNVAKGKLSYYAKDGTRDAGGTEYNYPIGGTSDSLMVDNQFDELELFIDDESWVFGGTTSGKPLLLAHLKDSNGINTIGSGIGREMEAIIDAGTESQQSVILNDYFKAQLNSYTEGTIEYPLENMSAGRHTLKLIVWDVYNNSAEAYTEFVIGENEDISLNNVLNYPNPFNNYTEFHFDHNKSGQNITVKLNILSVAGNVVKSITQEITNAPAHSSEITWDGRDDFGDRLARGVYLYNLEVRAEDGTTSSKTEKLYIVN